LDLVSFCPGVRNYPHTQTACLVLDELDIPYLVVERVSAETFQRRTPISRNRGENSRRP
jgi:hypothetical protein